MTTSPDQKDELAAPARPAKLRRSPHWYCAQLLAKPLFSLWFRFRAKGVEKIPAESGALLLINHLSFLDPMLVGLPIPRAVSYLARDSLFRVPFVGWWLSKTHVIPINRESAGTASIRAAVDRLRQGAIVGIFPEGTRSADGRLGELKPGFLALVRRAKVPVFPVGVAGSALAMPRGAWFVRPRHCCVVFGDAITPDTVESYSGREREDELIALVRDRMSQALNEAEAWRAGTSRDPEPNDSEVPAP
ncbi:MAG: lysophospholipid acyltransferase family protein [Planctomycetaceae bacterium]